MISCLSVCLEKTVLLIGCYMNCSIRPTFLGKFHKSTSMTVSYINNTSNFCHTFKYSGESRDFARDCKCVLAWIAFL